jgi:hypothetical protein
MADSSTNIDLYSGLTFDSRVCYRLGFRLPKEAENPRLNREGF